MLDENSHVAVPIGPHRYFVATNPASCEDYLRREATAVRLATAFNRAQAQRAVRRMFALKPTQSCSFATISSSATTHQT